MFKKKFRFQTIFTTSNFKYFSVRKKKVKKGRTRKEIEL